MKIGVILFGLLGDVLMRSAALRELRQMFPRATIHCYVDPVGAEVLSLSKDIGRVVKVVDRSRRSYVFYLWQRIMLHWSIRAESFDILIDLYNGPSSHWLLMTSKARKLLMLRDSRVIAIPPSRAPTMRSYENKRHLSNHYFSLLGHLDAPGYCIPDVRPWVDADNPIKNFCDFDHRHYLVSVATGDPKKNLPFWLVRRIADYLYRERGLLPVLVCNPGQEHLQSDLEKYLTDVGVPCVRLGFIGLIDLFVLMRSVRLSILPDTGLFHLALAAGGPVLGIFTHTPPQLVDPKLPQVSILFEENSAGLAYSDELPFGTKEIPVTLAIERLRVLLSITEQPRD